ncbi:MAG TPA: hypothetical protein VEW42_05920 [Candidatus Eisenbacteria bacterium]|nr:hypothetical protein [Candidatus Eisenbacteria bacterium]
MVIEANKNTSSPSNRESAARLEALLRQNGFNIIAGTGEPAAKRSAVDLDDLAEAVGQPRSGGRRSSGGDNLSGLEDALQQSRSSTSRRPSYLRVVRPEETKEKPKAKGKKEKDKKKPKKEDKKGKKAKGKKK